MQILGGALLGRRVGSATFVPQSVFVIRESVMPSIAMLSLVVRDYDEALAFYVGGLGFELIEDTAVPEQNKRWVVIAPPGGSGATLLLARAVGEEQVSRIGNQTGGRVFLFLHTDNFDRDFARFESAGATLVRPPSDEPFGRVAVFADLYGNLWVLIEPA